MVNSQERIHHFLTQLYLLKIIKNYFITCRLDTPTTNYRSTQTSGKVIASFSQGTEIWVESKRIENIRYRDTAGAKMNRLMYQPPLHRRSGTDTDHMIVT